LNRLASSVSNGTSHLEVLVTSRLTGSLPPNHYWGPTKTREPGDGEENKAHSAPWWSAAKARCHNAGRNWENQQLINPFTTGSPQISSILDKWIIYFTNRFCAPSFRIYLIYSEPWQDLG